ncbi:MAG: DNA-directed RNA polymerase subunit omega [Bacteroidota bacterium]|nr:DNA-directed RNA polymerase subunit omega [Bacteroidota bacterium]
MNIPSFLPTEVTSRDLRDIENPTANIYESIVVISKRANQISAEIKEELTSKLSEFAPATDNLDEVFENREQIEISTYYEKLPKASIISTEEFLADKTYFRNPNKESQQDF